MTAPTNSTAFLPMSPVTCRNVATKARRQHPAGGQTRPAWRPTRRCGRRCRCLRPRSDAPGLARSSVAFDDNRLGSKRPFLPIGSPETTSPYGPSRSTRLGDRRHVRDPCAGDRRRRKHPHGRGHERARRQQLPAVTLSGVATNAKVRGSLSLSATASDAGSGVQSLAFEYRLGSSGAFLPIGSPDTRRLWPRLVRHDSCDRRQVRVPRGGDRRRRKHPHDAATNVLVDNASRPSRSAESRRARR